MKEQYQAKLDLFLARNPIALDQPATISPTALCQSATELQNALGITARLASVLAAAHPQKEEVEKWLEDGRLPCSFSLQLLWEPILAQLDDFDLAMAKKRSAIAHEQQEKEKASQGVQSTQEDMEKLRHQLDGFQEEERSHAEKEKLLQAELKALEKIDVATLRSLVECAAKAEKKLVAQVEAQLEDDKEGLLALSAEGSPKLSLLLNCFGADANTIQALRDLSSEGLVSCEMDDLKPMISALPKPQQIVALYTRERLKEGELPYAGHDCGLCNCETAEEMASFLNENGLKQVTADTIRKTGASGRGALLFLSTQDLQLEAKDQKALLASRQAHRKSKN